MAGHSHTLEETLRYYAKEYSLTTFVETGTFKGTTTEIASKIFDKVYTIELSEGLYAAAKEKFKDTHSVTCLLGDSSEILPELIKSIAEDTLFFLDAHWAGNLSARAGSDSPLLREAKILSERNAANRDLIVIDDVSFFDQKGQREFLPGSAYFPEGGLFEWDWRGISREFVLSFFPHKESLEKDDRLFIGIRRD